MKIEVVDPTFKIEMTLEEVRFLYRLIGFHIVGEGVNRVIANGIYAELEKYSQVYFKGCRALAVANKDSNKELYLLKE